MASSRASGIIDGPLNGSPPPTTPRMSDRGGLLLRRPHRGVRRLVTGLAAALVLFAITVALVPVTQTIPVGPDAATGPRVGLPLASRVVITQSEPGTVVVQPSLIMPEVFTSALVQTGGSFSADQRGWTSTGPGSMTFEGTFGDLNLSFTPGSEAAGVSVRRESEGHTQTWRLSPDGPPSARTLHVLSPVGQSSTSHLYLFRGGEMAAGGQATVGGEAIRAEGGRYTGTAALATVAGAALSGWGIFATGVLGLVVLWLIGRSLLGASGASSAARAVPTVSIGLALGLVLCLSNTLAYVVSARYAAYLVLLMAAVSLVVGHRRLRAGLREDLRPLATRIGWVLPAAAIAFFPVFYWGMWFAGQYRTDLYEYASLSSIVRGNSLFDMRHLAEAAQSGTVTSGAGFVWRSIDSVAGSAVSAVTGLSSVPGLSFVALMLCLVSGVAVMDLAAGHNPGAKPVGRVGMAITAVTLLNPLLTGLFIENYYSQFFFVALLPVLVVMLRTSCDPWAASPSAGVLWAVAAVAGVMIAAYPYFFAVAVASLALAMLVRSDTRRRSLRLLWPVAWRVLVLVNLAFLTVLRYGETTVYEADLDAIARNVLIPGWGPVQLASMFGGLRSYQLRGAVPDGEVTGPLGTIVGLLDSASTPSVGLLALALLLVLVLLASVDLRATFASFQAVAVYTLVLAWVVFCLYYGWSHRSYVMLKSGWVAAALLPCVIAVTRFHRRGRWAALVAVSGLAATAWLPTMLADRATWVVPLSGTFNRAFHVSVVPDLALARTAVEPGVRVALVMGSEPLAGSDRNRVLLALTVVQLRDAGVVCVNCQGSGQPLPLDCTATRPDMVITIGAAEPADVCGLALSENAPLTDVYVR